MKPRHLFTAIAFAISMLMLMNCSQGKKSDKQSDTLSGNVTDEPAPAFKMYGIKSGIIEYKHSGSTSGTTTIYFDRYGTRTATHSDLIVNGQAEKGWIVSLDDTQYMYKEGTYQGVKMKNPMIEELRKVNDIEKLSEEMYAKMGFKPAGTEKHLGKECIVYKGDNGKVLTWKGMLMVMEMNVMGTALKQEATKMDLNAKVKPSVFELPEGITFTEMPAFGTGGV